ncbi:hypothetical protein OIV83_003383 [Microbotryomycetes sp. JL201]|nr:hypothetical protein OIV83_003383 [Microbotryomycetes sp. JL201]
MHTSRVTRSRLISTARIVSNSSAQHPGKSGLDHLENPSLSEEAVHAEKHGQDPLSDSQKAKSSTPSSGAPTQGSGEGVKEQAQGAWDKVKDAAGQLKDKVEKATK